MQVDIAQYCQYDFLMTRKTQLSFSVDKEGSHVEYKWGVIVVSSAFRPEIPTSGCVFDDVVGRELRKIHFQVIKRKAPLYKVYL